MEDPKEFGRRGEELAASHLSGLGYKILEKNYRTPVGEIDIVAKDGPTLVFVEVKSRRDESFGTPEMAVNFHKKRQLIRAALVYLSRRRMDVPCRFDVVGILAGTGGDPKISLIKDAFDLSRGGWT